MKEDRFGNQVVDIRCTFMHKPKQEGEIQGEFWHPFWAWKMTVEGEQFGTWCTEDITKEQVEEGFCVPARELLASLFLEYMRKTKET